MGGGMPFRREVPPIQANPIPLMSSEAKEAAGVLWGRQRRACSAKVTGF